MSAGSYRFARRSFLRGVGGAVGLKALLRGMEAKAAGAKPPPRLLIAMWPVGTVRPDYLPATTGANWSTTPILAPFVDAGLKGDMTAFLGFSMNALAAGGGIGDAAGVVRAMTGVSCPGVRTNAFEAGDAFAGGPSFDQIFLRDAPILQRSGVGYANVIGDSRVDFAEIAAQCLSYAVATQPVKTYSGGMATENVPLMPTLSPLAQFTALFSGFMPGGSTDPNQAALLRGLKKRKSVLDFSLRQLARLETLAPAAEKMKIEVHADAIRAAEKSLASQIDAAAVGGGGASCTIPAAPAPLVGQAADSKAHNDFGRPTSPTRDDPTHAMVGQLHLGVLKAAFVCDIIRVATFQWASSLSKVSFQGLYPTDLTSNYMHHPTSHQINTVDTLVTGPSRNPAVTFLSNVHTWYNTQTAKALAEWKTTPDGYGSMLLDQTVIPFLTDIAAVGHEVTNLPAMLFGGKALGFQHGRFLQLTPGRPLNDLWLTVGQAFGLSVGAAPLSGETFAQNTASYTGPIDGLWTKPA